MDEQSKLFIEESDAIEHEELERRRSAQSSHSKKQPAKPKPGKLGAGKLTPEE